ncbi:MAG: Pr6Pr family membrane protein [Actinomycetota bacterium]
MPPKWARSWFAATSAAVLAGVIIQLFVSANDSTAFGGSPLNRALNIFAYFTVLSNLVVGVTTLLLALNPNRTSTVFRVFRLIGVVAITVTFIVFHVALGKLLDLETWAQAANQLLHTVVPILALLGWCLFGPRGLSSGRIAKLTILFPLGYMIFCLIRGPLSSDFYPYHFADVHALGYLRVAINSM